MYAICYRSERDGGELIEMTVKEWRESLQKDRPIYTRVSAESARKWVKDGYTHMTPLYVNFDGKVRYAKDSN